MKLQLPAVNQPIVRVLVLTTDNLVHLDFDGSQPQEVDIELPGVDMQKAKIGYVGVAASGEEVGEPVLLHAEPEPPMPPSGHVMGIDVTDKGTTVLVTELPAENQLPAGSDKPKVAAEAPPETVKVEEKPAATVKTGRK